MTSAVGATNTVGTFVACIFDPADIVEIRRLPSGQSAWHVAKELPQVADELRADNNGGQNIHFGANPRKQRGDRNAEGVVLAWCLFADFDHVELSEAKQQWQSIGMPDPTVTISSGHGIHAYWRLTEPITDTAEWTNYQRDLIAAVGSDPAVHDPARLMRLPGFINHKEPAAPCTIIDADQSRVYELAELHEHIPRRAEPLASPATQPAPTGTQTKLDVIGRATLYASKCECVEEHAGRNTQATKLAAALTRDFDLSDVDALAILSPWNQGNSPPLGETELRDCLENGRRYGKHEVGSKLDAAPTRVSGEPPTDSLPIEPGPSWYTIPELGKTPAYRTGLPPLSTGYDDIDKVLRGGFRSDSVYVLAGRTGSSKSTLALNIARKVALGEHSVLVFKLEESPVEALWRIHAATAHVSLNAIMDGMTTIGTDGQRKLNDAWSLLCDLPLRISDRRRDDAIDRISREHVAAGGRLIVVDQLSMIEVPNVRPGYEQATAASNTLRRLARDLHVPILVVCQINRPASKNDGPLTCHDLRDSGAIENDAAAVILINKVREPDATRWNVAEPVRYLKITIGKNRYGPTKDKDRPIELTWWPRYCRIESSAMVEASE